jgi:histidinol-phosphate aminotransferase
MTTPQFRKALDHIPAYKAGRPPEPGVGPSYKLSSNENPYPPLPSVLAKIGTAAEVVNRYPDMGVTTLHEAIAARHGVRPDQVASGTGSVAVLYHLLQAICSEGDDVVYAWRSFEAYPIAVGLTGARDVQVPLDADSRHDLPAMLAAITAATRVVLVCTPNNPTGPSVHRDELLDFVDAVPAHVLVVVDEAYREFVRDPGTVDALSILGGRPNVVVLRTFSKAYGLAGLRVGFGIGPTSAIEAIRKCALPFGVSHIAQMAALASLEAEAELLERVEALVVERTRVREALLAQGWRIPDAQGNFVWFPLGDDTLDFAKACDQVGVSIRPFAGDGARVSVGEQQANDLLLEVAAEWRSRS